LILPENSTCYLSHRGGGLSLETAIIKRYRRRDISIEEAIVHMHLAGASVRRMEDITVALWGMWVSSGTVSKLNRKVYKYIEW